MDLMRQPNTRLVRTNNGDGSCAYYLMPGGYVEPDVAAKIKKHELVSACGRAILKPGA
jgi:hypothetical protein